MEGSPQAGDPAPQPARRDAEQRLIDLAHDLRTPLAIIVGFTELLLAREDTLTPEQRRDYIQRTQTAAADMRAILDAERARRPAPR